MAHAALLLLVLAADPLPDGGNPFQGPLYALCPDAPPAQAIIADGGITGWMLPPERAARQACLLDTCEAHRQLTEKEALATPPPSRLYYFVGGVMLGIAVSFATSYAVVTALHK